MHFESLQVLPSLAKYFQSMCFQLSVCYHTITVSGFDNKASTWNRCWHLFTESYGGLLMLFQATASKALPFNSSAAVQGAPKHLGGALRVLPSIPAKIPYLAAIKKLPASCTSDTSVRHPS